MKQIQVSKFRQGVSNRYGEPTATMFMDQLQKWDTTVSLDDLYQMFYDRDVLRNLLENVL